MLGSPCNWIMQDGWKDSVLFCSVLSCNKMQNLVWEKELLTSLSLFHQPQWQGKTFDDASRHFVWQQNLILTYFVYSGQLWSAALWHFATLRKHSRKKQKIVNYSFRRQAAVKQFKLHVLHHTKNKSEFQSDSVKFVGWSRDFEGERKRLNAAVLLQLSCMFFIIFFWKLLHWPLHLFLFALFDSQQTWKSHVENPTALTENCESCTDRKQVVGARNEANGQS